MAKRKCLRVWGDEDWKELVQGVSQSLPLARGKKLWELWVGLVWPWGGIDEVLLEGPERPLTCPLFPKGIPFPVMVPSVPTSMTPLGKASFQSGLLKDLRAAEQVRPGEGRVLTLPHTLNWSAPNSSMLHIRFPSLWDFFGKFFFFFVSMMVNFNWCWLGKHQSRCHCEGVFEMRLTYKSVETE